MTLYTGSGVKGLVFFGIKFHLSVVEINIWCSSFKLILLTVRLTWTMDVSDENNWSKWKITEFQDYISTITILLRFLKLYLKDYIQSTATTRKHC